MEERNEDPLAADASSTATQSGPNGSNAPIEDDIYCPGCGYDLRGSISDAWSECGYALAGLRAPVSRIPWVCDRNLGLHRAYWRTVWMVLFRNRRFCEEYARPSVSYRHARTFQWVTVLHAYLLALLLTILFYATNPPVVPSRDDLAERRWATGTFQLIAPLGELVYAEVWPAVILHASLVLFLAAATGVPSYFLHPRQVAPQRQNNAVAMSYYACGPLAFTAVLALVVAVPVDLLFPTDSLAGSLSGASGVAACVLVFAWWLTLVRLARRTMPQLKTQPVIVAVAVPVLWVALAGVILIVLPALVLYVLVLIAAFTS